MCLLNGLSAPGLSRDSTRSVLYGLDFGRFDRENVQTMVAPTDGSNPARSTRFRLSKPSARRGFRPTALFQLRQHLLAIVLDLRIVLVGVLHGEPFFDKVPAFIFSAHLYVDCTESNIMH